MKKLPIVFFASSALIANQANAEAFKKFEPQLQVGSKFGNQRVIGLTKFMVPVHQTDNSLLFTDIRGRIDDNNSEEFNIGLGFRKKTTIKNHDIIFGGYSFYDRLYSSTNNEYHQLTLGLEAYTEKLEARVNYYIPENDQNLVATSLNISGGSIGVNSNFERALGGVDSEVGFKVPSKKYDFRVYAGGYYFEEDGYQKVAGPSGRVELTLNEDNIKQLPAGSELTIGFEAQHDDVRDDQYFGLVEFRIPFGFSNYKPTKSKRHSLSAIDKRMTKFIERDVDIVTGDPRIETEAAIIGGNTHSTVVTVDANDAITTEVTNAGANALVILDGTAGTINTATTVSMANGQTIISGGQTVTATGATSGRTVTATLPGSAATVNGTNAGNHVIATASNNNITAITITGGNDGIRNDNDDNVTITNVSISGTADDGIHSNDSSNLTISGGTISGVTDDGLDLNGGDDVAITGLTINNSGDDSILIVNDADTITINNVTITNAQGDAFDLNLALANDFDGLSGSGNTVTGTVGTDCNVTLNGNTVNGSFSYNATTCP